MRYLVAQFHYVVFFKIFHSRLSRYGLTSRWSIILYITAIFCLTALVAPVGVSPAHAQSSQFFWNSSKWFDWSDYRFRASGRGAFFRLETGTFKWGGIDYDLISPTGFNLIQDTGPHFSAEFELYVDRLGLRLHVNEIHFDGTRDSNIWDRAPKLLLGAFRGGLDLDLFRYPSAVIGVNFDYSPSDLEFRYEKTDAHLEDQVPDYFEAQVEGPITLGPSRKNHPSQDQGSTIRKPRPG